jgi:hypothetical protein
MDGGLVCGNEHGEERAPVEATSIPEGRPTDNRSVTKVNKTPGPNLTEQPGPYPERSPDRRTAGKAVLLG